MKLLLCVIITFVIVLGKDTTSPQAVSCPRDSSKSKHWNVTIQRQVLKSGFHRELSINITIVDKNADGLNDCHLLIKEELPRDVFVDPYQVGQLKEPNAAYQIYVPLDVDLEAAAHNAGLQTVYIFIDTSLFAARNDSSITMPFHIRYQRAVFADQNGKYVEVYWKSPTVLSRCRDQNLPHNCSHDTTTELCSPSVQRNCQWIKHHEIEPSTFLDFQVPRGDLNDLPLVITITSLVVLAGCIYLIKGILRPTKSVLKSA